VASRPWVTPAEVKAYSDRECVQARSDARLTVDISRAEQYVITYTHNDFSDGEKYPTVPEAVKTAALLLAEAYAYNAVVSSKELKSETFDDYSYTAERSVVSVESLDLAALLDDFIVAKANNAVTMRMRRL